MLKRLVVTEDGSHSLRMGDTDEHYHSIHGALQESMHVFIQAGLRHLSHLKELTIFEVGFGTGLNAYLTYAEALKTSQRINYVSIEAYPLEQEISNELNFNQFFDFDEHGLLLRKFHETAWNETAVISPDFKLLKVKASLPEYNHRQYYHLVYFDAFGPDFQPEMWTQEIFDKIYEAMHPGGILVTYCAKGVVRRMLKSAGFEVERIPGPPGKREMMRAIKKGGHLLI